MKPIIVFFLGVVMALNALAQPRLLHEIPVEADYIVTDNLANVYVVSGDKLTKYDKDGTLKLTYSRKVLGDIVQLDASNPLKLLLYYRDLTQVVFLDNRLSPRGEPVSLEDFDREQTTLTCTSHSSGMWLYDRFGFELTRLNQDLEVERQTGNLNQILGRQLNPNYLFEANSWVYLNDPAIGVLVFDIYGTYYKTIPIKGLERFKLFDGQLYYQEGGKVFRFHLRTSDVQPVALPEGKFRMFSLAEDRLYLLTEKALKIYARDS
ncbi:MAG: hypothetical protein AAGB22_06235 [Bacteroidota bacterium]